MSISFKKVVGEMLVMGLSLFKSCGANDLAEAPNPDPLQWELLEVQHFENAYVLKVRYKNCNNFEGVKVLVYKGTFIYEPRKLLDPHFDNTKGSPIARFRPDTQGWIWAINFAKSL